jgi:hypothetical protein
MSHLNHCPKFRVHFTLSIFGSQSYEKNIGFKVNVHISQKICPELYDKLLECKKTEESPAIAMRKLAEQALILTKLFTREQLQVPVSNNFFEISELIGTSAINNINKFTEANKFQSAKSNYDGFASNNAPESAQNNDSTALIGVQPISAVGSEKEVAKSTPLEPKNALIDSPPISAVRSSGSASMASRLAEMGKNP